MLGMFERAGKQNPNNEVYQFWQQNNQPIELWSNEVLDEKLDYIHNNPVVAGFVEEPWEYWYSSARDYSNKKGLIEIQFIA
jgi:hypothetical protein